MSNKGSSVLKVRFDTSTMAHGKVDKKTYRALAADLKPYGVLLAVFFAVTAIGGAASAYLPKILGEVIDAYALKLIESVFSGKAVEVTGEILPVIGFAAVLLAVNVISSFVQGFVVSRVTSAYSHTLRCRTFEKFNRLPASYADNNSHGSVIGTLTENVDALNQSLGLFLSNVIDSAVVIAAVTAMLFTVNKILCIVSVVFLAVSICVSYAVSKKETRFAANQQNASANINARLGEFYGGLRTVQESGEMQKNLLMLENLNEFHAEKTKKARRVTAISSYIGDLTLGICITAVAVIGAFMVKDGEFSIGALMTAVLYVRRLHRPVSQISVYAGVVRSMGEAAGRLFAFLNESEEKADGEKLDSTGEIVFDNVTFAYPGTNENVLQNVSFTIPSKGIISLSGDTGAGKSTLAKLMLKFYQPDEGAVYCGGKNIKHVETEGYRRQFSVINQEATLFEETFAANIAYGKENAAMRAIESAARLAGADEFISRLPDGYDTVFSASPQNISNGEIQLVLLARAFLNKTPYVIFDEATAYVDTKTETRVKETLAELSKNSAVIIIAHRHSTVENADKIIRIENGKIR